MKRNLGIGIGAVVILVLGYVGLQQYRGRGSDSAYESAEATVQSRSFEKRAPRTCDSDFMFFVLDESSPDSISCYPVKKEGSAYIAEPSNFYKITCDPEYLIQFEFDASGVPIIESCKGESI